MSGDAGIANSSVNIQRQFTSKKELVHLGIHLRRRQNVPLNMQDGLPGIVHMQKQELYCGNGSTVF